MLGRPVFTGSAEHSLDEKARLVVPARFRERLGAGFFLTIGDPDPCLALYPAAAFADLYAKIDAVPDDEKTVPYRAYVRKLLAHTSEVSVDSQGRLVIPALLRAYAGIEKDVISVGSLKRVELWAKERYERYAAEIGEIPDYASKLGLF